MAQYKLNDQSHTKQMSCLVACKRHDFDDDDNNLPDEFLKAAVLYLPCISKQFSSLDSYIKVIKRYKITILPGGEGGNGILKMNGSFCQQKLTRTRLSKH